MTILKPGLSPTKEAVRQGTKAKGAKAVEAQESRGPVKTPYGVEGGKRARPTRFRKPPGSFAARGALFKDTDNQGRQSKDMLC